jgi:hypothetical protein
MFNLLKNKQKTLCPENLRAAVSNDMSQIGDIS